MVFSYIAAAGSMQPVNPKLFASQSSHKLLSEPGSKTSISSQVLFFQKELRLFFFFFLICLKHEAKKIQNRIGDRFLSLTNLEE